MGLLTADICSGIGLLGRAWDSVGAKCVYACEIDESARQVYLENWIKPGVFDRDLFQVNPYEIPDFNLLSAGFPCQPYSVMNIDSDGKERERDIFWHIIKILEVKRPYLVFLENVKNLLHVDYGFTFRDMVIDLEKLGYKVDYAVINSFGWTQQRRKRLFILACQDNLPELVDMIPEPKIFLNKVLENDEDVPCTFDLTPKMLKAMMKRVGKFATIVDEDTKVFRTVLKRYLLAGSSGDFVRRPNGKLRYLTPKEIQRLFGVPDTFKMHPNYRKVYQHLGNAVVYNMVCDLVRSINANVFRSI